MSNNSLKRSGSSGLSPENCHSKPRLSSESDEMLALAEMSHEEMCILSGAIEQPVEVVS